MVVNQKVEQHRLALLEEAVSYHRNILDNVFPSLGEGYRIEFFPKEEEYRVFFGENLLLVVPTTPEDYFPTICLNVSLVKDIPGSTLEKVFYNTVYSLRTLEEWGKTLEEEREIAEERKALEEQIKMLEKKKSELPEVVRRNINWYLND